MKNKLKVYATNGQWDYIDPYDNFIKCPNIKDSDIILFTGGADVSPMLYGENKNNKTGNELYRDMIEKDIFVKNINKFKIGVCRGLNVAQS